MKYIEREIDGVKFYLKKKDKQKRTYLKITSPTGKVVVTTNSLVPDEDVDKFVMSHKRDIEKARLQIKELYGEVEPKEIIDGEKWRVWGENYTLKIITANKNTGKIDNEEKTIYLYVKEGVDYDKKVKLIKDTYRAELKKEMKKSAKKYEELTGLKANSYRTKLMKSRWGTCNIRDKRIWINLSLTELNRDYLDYVMLHEMTHLIYPRHNEGFYSHVKKYMPEYLEVERHMQKESAEPDLYNI